MVVFSLSTNGCKSAAGTEKTSTPPTTSLTSRIPPPDPKHSPGRAWEQPARLLTPSRSHKSCSRCVNYPIYPLHPLTTYLPNLMITRSYGTPPNSTTRPTGPRTAPSHSTSAPATTPATANTATTSSAGRAIPLSAP